MSQTQIWVATDGGTVWVAREGGAVPAVADPIEMAPGDVRTLVFDFGNLPEFWAGGGINLNVPPVVSVAGVDGTPIGLTLLLTQSLITFANVRALPVVVTNGSPLGLTLLFTVTGSEPFIGAYYVQMIASVNAVVTGTFTVSVTVALMDGTKLTRLGTLNVG